MVFFRIIMQSSVLILYCATDLVKNSFLCKCFLCVYHYEESDTWEKSGTTKFVILHWVLHKGSKDFAAKLFVIFIQYCNKFGDGYIFSIKQNIILFGE